MLPVVEPEARIGLMTAAAPVVDNVNIEFWDTDTLLLLELSTMPLMFPPPVTLLIVLLLRFAVVPLKPKLTIWIRLVPPVMLLNVFPVKVFAGASVAELPSTLIQPPIVVAPVTVMLEKLLLLPLETEPVGEVNPPSL